MIVLLSLVLLADPRAKTVDVSGGGTTELRGGRAPINPGDDPEPSVLYLLQPIGRLHFSARARAQGVVLTYSPRVMYRSPNPAGLNRPLLLHQATAAYSRRLSQIWTSNAFAGADVGELDYTSAQNLFGEQQGSLPDADITKYASTTAGLGFVGRIHPVQQLTIAPSVDYRTPYGESAVEPDPDDENALETLLPRQVGANLNLRHAYDVAPVDTLIAEVAIQYVDFSERGAQAIGVGTYGWTRQLSRRLASTVRAGTFATVETRAPDGIERTFTGSPVQPLVAAELDGRLYNRAPLRISGSFGFSNAAFVDSVTGEVVPRVGAFSRLSFFMPPKWTVGLEVNFTTVATREPRDFSLGGDDGIADPAAQQETALSWRTPVSVAFRDNYAVEFGTIWSVRGPHVRAGGFQFRQLESWLYVAFSFDYATGHVRARQAGGGGSTVTGGDVN